MYYEGVSFDIIVYIGFKSLYPKLPYTCFHLFNMILDVVCFQLICSYIFMPLAAVIGVQWSDTKSVGALIGKKIVINEFLAYADLGKMIQESALDVSKLFLFSFIYLQFL